MATRPSTFGTVSCSPPVYVVPKFGGSAYSARNLALSGWEISGILTLAQGFPYDISYAGGTSRSLWCAAGVNFYACPDVPEQIASPTHANLRLRQPTSNKGLAGDSIYVNNAQCGSVALCGVNAVPGFANGASIFTAEPIGTFGNVHRDPYHGPGINNTNMILAKNFLLSAERNISLQLRMESDNVFNHTQFSNPTSTYGSSALGVVSSAAAGRQSQLAAKIYF